MWWVELLWESIWWVVEGPPCLLVANITSMATPTSFVLPWKHASVATVWIEISGCKKLFVSNKRGSITSSLYMLSLPPPSARGEPDLGLGLD